jgi:murein DD-endopeptidase MepM/ murein hydrolase activator NlpD
MNYPRGIISVFLLGLLLSSPPPRLAAEDAVHVVEKGETVYSISRSYQVSPEELMKYNNIADASKLQAGKRLRIPPSAFASPSNDDAAATAAGTRAVFTEYRAVKNDTLYSIARTHSVTLKALQDLNQFPANYVLKAGDRIKIPADAARPAGPAIAAGEPRRTAVKPADSSLRWPVLPTSIAYMTGKLYGVMLGGERSEPVRSLTQGTVIAAGPYRGFGRVAIIRASGGYLYVYGGCESLSVKEGDRIGPGTELGKLGIDAVSDKPQLFFMVYRNNTPIDPAKAPRA